MNPYAFRFNDPEMKKELSPHYIPPQKRHEMREYLSKVGIWLPPNMPTEESTSRVMLTKH